MFAGSRDAVKTRSIDASLRMPRRPPAGEERLALAERQYRGNHSRGRDPEENTVIAHTLMFYAS